MTYSHLHHLQYDYMIEVFACQFLLWFSYGVPIELGAASTRGGWREKVLCFRLDKVWRHDLKFDWRYSRLASVLRTAPLLGPSMVTGLLLVSDVSWCVGIHKICVSTENTRCSPSQWLKKLPTEYSKHHVSVSSLLKSPVFSCRFIQCLIWYQDWF